MSEQAPILEKTEESDDVQSQLGDAAVEAASRLIEDPLRAQIMAETEDRNRDAITYQLQKAEEVSDEKAARGYQHLAQDNQDALEQRVEWAAEAYDDLIAIVNYAKEFASKASTAEEQQYALKSEELMNKALYRAGVTNPNSQVGLVMSRHNFEQDSDVRMAIGYAIRAGEAHLTREEVHAIKEKYLHQ